MLDCGSIVRYWIFASSRATTALFSSGVIGLFNAQPLINQRVIVLPAYTKLYQTEPFCYFLLLFVPVLSLMSPVVAGASHGL
jgi:hypothetical protein